jgi:hypothetical protein
MVTLHDGTQVSNYSEEHRHECEARAVLNMPRKSMRQDYLYGELDQHGKPRRGVLQLRGEAEVRRLESTILALWHLRKRAANDNEPA